MSDRCKTHGARACQRCTNAPKTRQMTYQELQATPVAVPLPATTPAATQTFQWPCEKRRAHGPHPLDPVECSDAFNCEEPSMLVGYKIMHLPQPCPGVGAHPATMAGGSIPEEVWNV